ncbi:unnamed protein product, partial [Rotaria sp. Silwood1]
MTSKQQRQITTTTAEINTSTVPRNTDDVRNTEEGISACGWVLVVLSYIICVLTFPFSLCVAIKVIQEYERAVIMRLGRILPGGAKGPGLFFILPCVDTIMKVDLRTVTFDVPPQEILTRDSVTVSVDAVVLFSNIYVRTTIEFNISQKKKHLIEQDIIR